MEVVLRIPDAEVERIPAWEPDMALLRVGIDDENPNGIMAIPIKLEWVQS